MSTCPKGRIAVIKRKQRMEKQWEESMADFSCKWGRSQNDSMPFILKE